MLARQTRRVSRGARNLIFLLGASALAWAIVGIAICAVRFVVTRAYDGAWLVLVLLAVGLIALGMSGVLDREVER